MSEIIPNVVVSMPSQLFTMARSFKACSNGRIYIGKIDTDPTISDNQIQVYLERENGAHIPTSQPIIINAAGYPVYAGQIAKFVTVEGHSMAVYDSYGAQQHYIPNVLKYDPDQFQIQLSEPDGSSKVGFIQDSADAMPSNLEYKASQLFTFDDFIPDSVKGNTETIDCSAYIQIAIERGFAAGRKVCGVSGKKYGISSTILIPQNFDSTFVKAQRQEIDGQGCVFNMLTDVTLFESGYYDNGVLKSNYGTILDSHYSKYIDLHGFSIVSKVGNLTAPTMRIQDWHHDSKIRDISCNCSATLLKSNNNYFTLFDSLTGEYPVEKVGDRFVFEGFHNLNKMNRLIATNAVTGYRFDGPVTALQMSQVSFEGQSVGVQFKATVYDLYIDGAYIENISNAAIVFAGYVHSSAIYNSYVNFQNDTNMRLVVYTPSPANQFYIDRSVRFQDMPSISNIVSGLDNTYGAGFTVDRPTDLASSINDFLLDNTHIGIHIGWRQEKIFGQIVGNVINHRITGNYAGQYSDGLQSSNGFEWINTSSTTLLLRTRAVRSLTEMLYVNISVEYVGGTKAVSGLFVAGKLYEFTSTGVKFTLNLALNSDNPPYVQIEGANNLVTGIITDVKGEIRIL
ncbi:phage head-binding domain-containing protein [Xenorhabdus ehlersii]|uniref:Head binding protein n=1 Tax=Xenorhabdus ehlersii TaxID=290111 RepID=A0A2D0IX98_9GAMM|nr:phage head-binding domain-containing protein [Xenorhabdus ehlersii]PHM26531.1 hypothetical protein Xehl_00872 [Xenorhabdus ehlersii]RKE91776.1 head binding protein [Xenorhabdus ehlersii]